MNFRPDNQHFLCEKKTKSVGNFRTLTVCNKTAYKILEHLPYMGLDAGFVNNKDADQPAHPCSLISAFVICLFVSIIF